ncbi:MAG: hypothetical protein INR62_04880 [Rhodospirillales bacterium]|nr:hypothetical protein [Acetobacter sp.]
MAANVQIAPNEEQLRFNKIANELHASGSDRSTAILGGTLMESLLRELILHAAVPDPKKEFERYINGAGVSALQVQAFVMGLIPRVLLQELRLISDIRNRFAHGLEPLSFDKPPVSGFVENLVAPRRFSPLSGAPVTLPGQAPVKTLRDLPKRLQFIASVAAASATLEHLRLEVPKFKESTRFYVDPKTGGAPN